MTSPKSSDERHRDGARCRSWLNRSAAPWLIVLISGIVVLVIGSISFASATAQLDAPRPGNQPAGASVPPPAQGPAMTSPRVAQQPQRVATQPPALPSTDTGTGIGEVGSHPTPPTRPTRLPRVPIVVPPKASAAASVAIPEFISLGNSNSRIRVIPIGVSSEGVLEPPTDISMVGWWVSGPRPGAPGRAVITGHIDSPAGLGAFAALDGLHDGDPVVLTGTDGDSRHYRVTDRQEIEKTNLNPALITRTTNRSDLLLVTCIGTFNSSTLSYESNLLITAVQVGP